MYQITSGNNKHYADKLTHIRVNKENGCYVICDEHDADGVCVKIPVEITTEDGIITTMEDTVFATVEGGLNGTENICHIELAQTALDYYNTKRSEELLSMIEEVL